MKTYKHYQITPEAEQEFKDAQLHYKLTNVKGLQNRFTKAVKSTIAKILKNPGACAIRYRNVRIAYTPIFPYAIHFVVEEKLIYIVAIIYERRDPDITLKRV